MVRPTRRAGGLVLGAAILFAVGTNVQAGWVLVLAALLIGAAITGMILPARMVRGVGVERRAPAEASAGDAVEVDLVVSNRHRRSKLSLLIADRFIAPATVFVPVLERLGRSRVTTLRSPARRGVVEGDPVVVSSSAPFGVATARRRVPAEGRTVVFPRVVPIPRLAVLERPARPEPAARPAPRRGAGQDFLGTREYRTGDSLRHIHWPSTARHGTLIVREFEREEPRKLTILVDTWADAGIEGPESALDVACAAAASATSYALAQGAVVTLAAGLAGVVEVRTRAGRGEALELLAALRAPGNVPVDALGETVDPGDAVLIVAPTWAANAIRLPALCRSLRDLGADVQVVLVDAAAFGRSQEAALDPAGAGRMGAEAVSAGAAVARVGHAGRGDEGNEAGADLAAALSVPGGAPVGASR